MTEWDTVDAPAPLTNAQRSQRYRSTPNGKARVKAAKRAWRSRQTESAYLSRRFVAWDGEGVTRDNGQHDYILLASSAGDSLSTARGYLGTEMILDFLLEMTDPNCINVIYGASYDWNCWMCDLTEDEARILYTDGMLEWNGFLIRWRPGKQFSVRKGKAYAQFYDVVSFFQTTFVMACDQYLGDSFEDREMIVENKRLRSSFRPDDLREIARYNQAELRNLVRLMEELRIRLHRAGIDLDRWTGPGIVASTTMKNHGVENHIDQQTPEFVREAAQHAYFGGRFEIIQTGYSENPVWEYDLNSAYPWGLLDVPSLSGAEWSRHDGYVPGPDFTLYHIRWENGRSNLPQPFPCRYDDYSVAYPFACEGWYWGPEIKVAQEYVKRYGGTLTILETIFCKPATGYKPFGYIAGMYAARRKLKAAGDGAHVAYKLSLNSHYGKLCQQLGARKDQWGYWHIPPWHQIEWAGYITSKCRATVLRAALGNLSAVVAWETDALFVTEPLDLNEGGGLGEWERTKFDDLAYLQSGFYFGTVDGKPVDRTRGVDRGELSRDTVLPALRGRTAETLPAKLTRFITLGAALQSRWPHWRRWETLNKNVALMPVGKRVHVACQTCQHGGEGWHSTLIAPWAVNRLSKRYDVVWESESLTVTQQWRLEDNDGSGIDD